MRTTCRYCSYELGDMNRVNVQIFEEFGDLLSEGFLERVAQLTLDHEQVERGLGLVVADDETVRDLNKTYRGVDRTTDVLSFAFDSQGQYYGEASAPSDWTEDVEFVVPPSEEGGLGEVIISYPQARRQAQDSGRDVNDELARLVTHGILHLLGHDHVEDGEWQAMTARETSILAQAPGAANE